MAAAFQRAPPQTSGDGVVSCLKTYNVHEGTISYLQTFDKGFKERGDSQEQSALLPEPPERKPPPEEAEEDAVLHGGTASMKLVETCGEEVPQVPEPADPGAEGLLSTEGTYRIVDIERKDAMA